MQLINTTPMIKDALSSLRPFLATKSSLRMMKDAFHLSSEALFVLKFLSLLFGQVAKRLN